MNRNNTGQDCRADGSTPHLVAGVLDYSVEGRHQGLLQVETGSNSWVSGSQVTPVGGRDDLRGYPRVITDRVAIQNHPERCSRASQTHNKPNVARIGTEHVNGQIQFGAVLVWAKYSHAVRKYRRYCANMANIPDVFMFNIRNILAAVFIYLRLKKNVTLNSESHSSTTPLSEPSIFH